MIVFTFLDVNECLAIECLNNATCVNIAGTYQCQCTVGWTGEFCGEGKEEARHFTRNWNFW